MLGGGYGSVISHVNSDGQVSIYMYIILCTMMHVKKTINRNNENSGKIINTRCM